MADYKTDAAFMCKYTYCYVSKAYVITHTTGVLRAGAVLACPEGVRLRTGLETSICSLIFLLMYSALFLFVSLHTPANRKIEILQYVVDVSNEGNELDPRKLHCTIKDRSSSVKMITACTSEGDFQKDLQIKKIVFVFCITISLLSIYCG